MSNNTILLSGIPYPVTGLFVNEQFAQIGPPKVRLGFFKKQIGRIVCPWANSPISTISTSSVTWAVSGSTSTRWSVEDPKATAAYVWKGFAVISGLRIKELRLFSSVRGFFNVVHFTVKKKNLVSVRLDQIRLGFFWRELSHDEKS